MFENQACFIFSSPVTAAHMVAPANWPGEGGGGGGGVGGRGGGVTAAVPTAL